MYLFYDVNLTILPLDRPITAEFINNSFVSTNDQLNSKPNHLIIKLRMEIRQTETAPLTKFMIYEPNYCNFLIMLNRGFYLSSHSFEIS